MANSPKAFDSHEDDEYSKVSLQHKTTKQAQRQASEVHEDTQEGRSAAIFSVLKAVFTYDAGLRISLPSVSTPAG